MTQRTVVLATSAPEGRPEYKRDFLTCLASPDGQRVAFSYKKSWFEPAVLSQNLAGRRATIVFCQPVVAASFSFIAVRHARISRLVPDNPLGLRDSTAITIEFVLSALVAAADQELPDLRRRWDEQIGSLANRPRPSDAPDDAKSRFVLETASLTESPGPVSQEDSWRTLSVALGECSSLSKAFFFRVGPIRKPGTNKPVKLSAAGALEQLYELGASAEYELPLDAYSASGATPYTEAITATSSSDNLTVQALTQSSAGRASQAVLVIRTGEVFRQEIATVIVAGAKGLEHEVPRVQIAARITRNRLIVVALTMTLALSVFAAGMAKGTFGLSDTFSYVVNVLGSLLAAALAVLAIGKGVKA
jgi:hypothetical protein